MPTFAPCHELWGGRDSVVRSWLRLGADGWRLDTAYELGPRKLAALRAAAYAEKPDSLVVGEIVNYPGEGLGSLDAVKGFTLRQECEGTSHFLANGDDAPRLVVFKVINLKPLKGEVPWTRLSEKAPCG